jgi:hypothetical protein
MNATTKTPAQGGTMTTLARGTRKAIISPMGKGRFSVWVGYDGGRDEDFATLWFNGRRTYSKTFRSEQAALKAAEKYLSH